MVEPERNRSEVVTTDALVEGVHFDRAYVPPAAIGHKALAVNLSDLAAMGAEPRAALLSLVLPGRSRCGDLDAIDRRAAGAGRAVTASRWSAATSRGRQARWSST